MKLYQARDVAAAMAQVRAELGGEALILSTRRTGDGVEVTAALEDQPPPAPIVPMLVDAAREAALAWHGVPGPLARRMLSGNLAEALRDRLAFAPLPISRDDAPLLLAGPPGAGKTLTAAKLATRLVLAGQAPLMIAADGKRSGATEQLAAFTRLLGLQLVVAHTPVAIARAFTLRREATPIIIDGPGTDPFDPTQREEIVAFASAINARTALVLGAGLCPAEAGELGAAYADAGASFLVATKLDIARRLGGILAAADAGGLSLTEGGIGVGAADGLARLTPESLAERLMVTAEARASRPQRMAA